jgi:hypothetical protein
MECAKTEVQRILDILPDDASLEAIHYHLAIRLKIQQGWVERDVISLDEMQRRLAGWLVKRLLGGHA